MNAIEIMLDLLDHIQGELFADAKAVDIGSYDTNSYVNLELKNKDVVKISIDYKPHQDPEKEDANV